MVHDVACRKLVTASHQKAFVQFTEPAYHQRPKRKGSITTREDITKMLKIINSFEIGLRIQFFQCDTTYNNPNIPSKNKRATKKAMLL